jgi:phage regulator Rha-like protein
MLDNLVFLEPSKIDAIPFTTSDIIAEKTGNNYRSVQRTIENQMKRLSTFGQVRIEITPVKYSRLTNEKKVCKLNESQNDWKCSLNFGMEVI